MISDRLRSVLFAVYCKYVSFVGYEYRGFGNIIVLRLCTTNRIYGLWNEILVAINTYFVLS